MVATSVATMLGAVFLAYGQTDYSPAQTEDTGYATNAAPAESSAGDVAVP